jgi:hypothetical protein
LFDHEREILEQRCLPVAGVTRRRARLSSTKNFFSLDGFTQKIRCARPNDGHPSATASLATSTTTGKSIPRSGSVFGSVPPGNSSSD